MQAFKTPTLQSEFFASKLVIFRVAKEERETQRAGGRSSLVRERE